MTRMTKQILTVTMGLVVLFPAARALAQSSEHSARCYAINVGTPDSEQDDATPHRRQRASRRAPEFSASQILDLEFRVLLPPSLNGNHQLELKVMTPKGHLYQSLSVPFSDQNEGEQEGGRESRGRRSRRTRSLAATATLPVAGTTIVTSSLYGKWHVEAYLDGAQTVCTPPQSFVIEP
jgi:hypothetical protein